MSLSDVIFAVVVCACTVALVWNLVRLAYYQGKLEGVRECQKILEESWRNAEKRAEEDREVSDD